MRMNVMAFGTLGLLVASSVSCGSQAGGDNQPRPASAATAACPGGEPSAEEYAVLSAVMQGLYGEGTQRFVVTTEAADANNEAMAAKNDPPLDKGALEDLRKKGASRSCLEAKFTVGKPVEMIAENDANAFFKDDVVKGWAAFDAKYPGSQGILRLSRVGFSADGNTAILFAANAKAALNAEGVIVVLAKQAGAWSVSGKHILWIA